MTASIELDDYDLNILRALQDNAELSMQEIGEKVGLSHTPCWRRIKRLEADGVIQGKVTLLNPRVMDLSVTVHALVNIKQHDEDSLNAFEDAVANVPEVLECYSTSGNTDYLLKIIVKNVDHYERFMKHTLGHLPNVASFNSTFALKQIKYTTKLPI